MLLTIDRVQIATPDAKSAAEMWRRRLGAEQVSADRVRGLGAKRVTLRAGTGEIELLEPEGNGVVADELARRGRSHLQTNAMRCPRRLLQARNIHRLRPKPSLRFAECKRMRPHESRLFA